MTAAEIAEVLDMALSTVSRWLARIGLGKRSCLSPPEPPNRYERKRPGELIHVEMSRSWGESAAGAPVIGSSAIAKAKRGPGQSAWALPWPQAARSSTR
jgi:hypothetical protein